MRLAPALIGITLASVAPAITAGPAHAASPGGFGVHIVPANGDAAGAPAYFQLDLRAGGSATEQVEVENHSTRTLRFAVSAVDGLTASTSGAVYANREVPVRETGRWVTPATRHLDLAAGDHARVGLVVRPPAGTPPGQYLAGLAVEDRRPRVSAGTGFRVRTVLRTVVGVLVHVPGRQRFIPKISGLGIRELPGPRVASVQVRLGNAGRRLGRPVLTVTLRGPAGYHRTVTRRLDTVLGGDSITYPDTWPDPLAAGRYDVTATLSADGATATRRARVRLGTTLRGLRAEVPAAAPGDDGHRRWPVLPVLLAGVAGGLALGRRSRKSAT